MQQTNVVRLPEPGALKRQQREDATIRRALNILARRMGEAGQLMQDPSTVKRYLRLRLGQLGHELFGIMYLDCKHRLIAHEELFRGTLTQTTIYPREVVKGVMAHNARSVLLYHNHPSGVADASEADKVLTQALRSALALIDVNVLDHIIVTATGTHSMAEYGEL